MADIVNINTIREFKRILLKSGTVLDGNTLTEDENFYSYIEKGDTIVKKLESELTEADNTALLKGAKIIRLQDMSDEFENFLEIGFEYPASSGDFYSLDIDGATKRNSISRRKSSLAYPFVFNGMGEAKVTFANSTALDTFDAAALTAHEIERQSKLIPAENLIRAATTIDGVYAVNY